MKTPKLPPPPPTLPPTPPAPRKGEVRVWKVVVSPSAELVRYLEAGWELVGIGAPSDKQALPGLAELPNVPVPAPEPPGEPPTQQAAPPAVRVTVGPSPELVKYLEAGWKIVEPKPN